MPKARSAWHRRGRGLRMVTRPIMRHLTSLLSYNILAGAFRSPIALQSVASVRGIKRATTATYSAALPVPESVSDALSATPIASRRPLLIFPGGGIFFWWQAGAISALQERYDLSAVDFVGASAGALAATLAACNADMDRGMSLALKLCDINKVWSRPLGLGGVWGSMVESWLDELLPADADERCRHRVHLWVLGTWPRPLKREAISDFTSRDDLVRTCMASVHIPYFMNKRFSARLRGRRYVDGSFRVRRQTLTLGHDRPIVFLDYEDDKVMRKRRRKFLSLTNQEGLLTMRQRGYEHVQTMIRDGRLDCLETLILPPSEPSDKDDVPTIYSRSSRSEQR